MLKNWLDSVNLIYYETTRSYSWGNLLRTIKQDVILFVEDGGWDAILALTEDEYDESDNDPRSNSCEDYNQLEDLSDSVSDSEDPIIFGNYRDEIGEDMISEEHDEDEEDEEEENWRRKGHFMRSNYCKLFNID